MGQEIRTRDLFDYDEKKYDFMDSFSELITGLESYVGDIVFELVLKGFKAKNQQSSSYMPLDRDKLKNVNTLIPDLGIWKDSGEPHDKEVESWAYHFADAMLQENAFCMLDEPSGQDLTKYSFFKSWLVWDHIYEKKLEVQSEKDGKRARKKEIELIANFILFEKYLGFYFTNNAYEWIESCFSDEKFISQNELDRYLTTISNLSKIKPFVVRKKILSFIMKNKDSWFSVRPKWEVIVDVVNNIFLDLMGKIEPRVAVSEIIYEWTEYCNCSSLSGVCNQLMRELNHKNLYGGLIDYVEDRDTWETNWYFLIVQSWVESTKVDKEINKEIQDEQKVIIQNIKYWKTIIENERKKKENEQTESQNDKEEEEPQVDYYVLANVEKSLIKLQSNIQDRRRELIRESIMDIKDGKKYDRIKLYARIHKTFFEYNFIK